MRSGLKALIITSILVVKALALTGGPAMPEYTQFEPFDATDMVSLSTGNFTYNIPLVNVPGIGGGFPISISYHSGIQQGQEATWVGLGWTLNPGAINRTVRGFADDLYGASVATHIWDAGGSVKGWGFGLGVGIGPVGLSMGWDSNTGLSGINMTFDLIAKLPGGKFLGASLAKKGINASVSVGTNGASLNAGIGYKFKNGATVGIGGSIGTGGVSYGGGVSLGKNYKKVGVSWNSTGGGSFSIGGVRAGMQASQISVTNDHISSISSSSSGGLYIPIPYGWTGYVSLNWYSYSQEWWLNVIYGESDHGYLYQQGYVDVDDDLCVYKSAGRVKYIPDYFDLGERFESQNVDEWMFSGQDVYSVSAQGIGGVMMPISMYPVKYWDVEGDNYNDPENDEATINNQNTWNSILFDIDLEQAIDKLKSNKIQFRMLGDIGKNSISSDLINDNVYDMIDYIDGDDPKRLVGSKVIFPVIDEKYDVINGFKIVDSDGKIYEFMFPLYNYLHATFTTTESEGLPSYKTKTHSFYKNANKIPYAWLLTAVKGPDYIDMTNDNDKYKRPMNGDYGYWARLDYQGEVNQNGVPINEKYLYKWRAPYGKNNMQLISKQNEPAKYHASYGLKDISYLRSVETATHKAVFYVSSDYRKDGQGDYLDYGKDKVLWPSSNYTLKSVPTENIEREDVGSFIGEATSYVSVKNNINLKNDKLSELVDGGYVHPDDVFLDIELVYIYNKVYLIGGKTQQEICFNKKIYYRDLGSGEDSYSGEWFESDEYNSQIGTIYRDYRLKKYEAYIDSRALNYFNNSEYLNAWEDMVVLHPTKYQMSTSVREYTADYNKPTFNNKIIIYFDNIDKILNNPGANKDNILFKIETKYEAKFETNEWRCEWFGPFPVECGWWWDGDQTRKVPGITKIITYNDIKEENINREKGYFAFEWSSYPNYNYKDDERYSRYKLSTTNVNVDIFSNVYAESYGLNINNRMKKLNRIELFKKGDFEPYQTVEFNYDYLLCKNTPNSTATNEEGGERGKLTLKDIITRGKNGQALPPYTFKYGTNYNFGYDANSMYKNDVWGFYKEDGAYNNHKVKQGNPKEGVAWNLTEITTPIGGVIKIEMERDEYLGASGNRVTALDLPIPKNSFNTYTVNSIDQDGWITLNNIEGVGVSDKLYIKNFQDYKYRYEALIKETYCSWGGCLDELELNYWGLPIEKTVERITYGGVYNIVEIDENNNKIKIDVEDNLGSNPNMDVNAVKSPSLPVYEWFGKVPEQHYYPGQEYSFKYTIGEKRLAPNYPKVEINKQEVMVITDNYSFYGGDTRVTSIEINNGLGDSYKTRYSYNELKKPGRTSGRIFKSPGLADSTMTFIDGTLFMYVPGEGHVTKKYDNFRADYEGPSGYVIYGCVTVENLDKNDEVLNGKTVYEYYTSDDVLEVNGAIRPVFGVEYPAEDKMVIRDYSSILGQPKRMVMISGGSENDTLKSEKFEYLFSEEIKSSSEGKTKIASGTQVFSKSPLGMVAQTHKFYNDKDMAEEKTVTRYINNAFMVGLKTDIDNIGYVSETQKYDAFTGSAIQTAFDQIGDNKPYPAQISTAEPAYWNSGYYGMKRKNMLTQVYKTKMYNGEVDNSKLMSATVNTWANNVANNTIDENNRPWYKYETWQLDMDLNKDGIADNTNYQEYPLGQNTNWLRTGVVTRYDNWANVLESQDGKGIATARIYGYDNSLLVALIANAKYNEAGYEGFEYTYNIGWIGTEPGLQYITNKITKTGEYAWVIKSNELGGFIQRDFDVKNLDKTGSYTFSAWVYAEQVDKNINILIKRLKYGQTDGTIIGSDHFFEKDCGNWKLLSVTVDLDKVSGLDNSQKLRTIVGNYGKNGIECYLDDIRFYPADALMATYTYAPDIQKITSVTDENNNTKRYEYDGMGRLVREYKTNSSAIIKEYTYKSMRE